MHRIVLLPGLDGTGTLFEGFTRAAPSGVHLDVAALPREPLSYPELAASLAPRLQLDADTVLLAESFSGPLAILLAQHRQLRTLVLCNTFVVPPRPRALAALPFSLLFHLPLPGAIIRRYLVGRDASDALVKQVQTTVATVPARVLAARVSSVLTVNVGREFAQCTSPLLYLRGTEDHLVSDASLDKLVKAASVPVSVARIPGPHLLLQAAPDAAWRAIENSLLRAPAA
jgi:pimeloyl-[acyl-carrier protein] methyl ester esterase